MPEPKPIPTKYNGVQYRSRLEARWAAFFDQLGIDYYYEYEGFQLPSGWYVPDFFLPSHGWFEIKPKEPSERECKLAHEMVSILRAGDLQPYEYSNNLRERFYILVGFPLEMVYAPNSGEEDAGRKLEGNLWLENHDTKEIYFSLNFYYDKWNDESLLYCLLFGELAARGCCSYCHKFHTCSAFTYQKSLLMNEIFESMSNGAFILEYDTETEQELQQFRKMQSRIFNRLKLEHDAVKEHCKYLKSEKIDAAYQFAKKFRFF